MSFPVVDAPRSDLRWPEGQKVARAARRSQKAQREGEATRERDYRALVDTVRWAVDAGTHIPCVADADGGWTSDSIAGQLVAAAECLDCPLIEQCRAYIDEHPERSGVWAATLPPK